MDIDSVCFSNSLGPGNNLFNTFLMTMASIHCNISASVKWPTDYGKTALKYGLDEYDFVVIGAGTAGSVVAGRLAENIHSKILLIETGDDPPMESEVPGLWTKMLGSRVDWSYKTEPDRKSGAALKNSYFTWNNGKMLGGSHSMNAMAYIRGPPQEYDEWEQAGNPTWGWNDVLYYFKKTEKFRGKNPFGRHGVHGPMNVEPPPNPQFEQRMIMKAASELGHVLVDDFTDGPDVGFGKVYGTVRNGRRWSTAKAFLRKCRPNLHVIKNAFTYKIDFTSNLRAKAVRFMYKEIHEMKVHARKEIILCAGSIETPKLLMLSGIGPKTHLNALGIPAVKDLAVGNNLQAHVVVNLFIRYRRPEKDKNLTKEFLDSIYKYWVHRKGPYSSGSFGFEGFLSTDGNPSLPDIHCLFSLVNNVSSTAARYHDHIAKSIISRIADSDRVIQVLAYVGKPRSRGYLKLRTTDYRDSPLIYPNYFHHSDDLNRMAKGIKALVEFERTETFKKLDAEFVRVDIPECDKYKYRSTKYWECYARYMSNPANHYVGTTKMGPQTDSAAVVNPQLEVYGVQGLRVVDAGIMPTMVRVSPNAVAIMIGEKGADFIKNKWNL